MSEALKIENLIKSSEDVISWEWDVSVKELVAAWQYGKLRCSDNNLYFIRILPKT